MTIIVAKFIPEDKENAISVSRNYRIYSQINPIYTPIAISSYQENISFGALDPQNLNRYFRYSLNKLDWSLWQEFIPDFSTGANIRTIMFDTTRPLFIEVKFEYTDGTSDILSEPVIINSCSFSVQTRTAQPVKSYEFQIKATSEMGPTLDLDKLATFRPYAVNSSNQLNIGMSYQANLMFGHEVVYFRALPDLTSGDFVFKEWTIQNVNDRKCIKVMVPNNEFPDNKPKFNEFGFDFEQPFEVHIDNSYFQLIFGINAKPRVRDFMYIPIMDRMFEVKSSYVFKGFMLEPIYWKLSLVKYKPSVDMVIDQKHQNIIDDLITSAETLFKPMVESEIANTSLHQQFDTSTTRKDPVRHSISNEMKIKPFNRTFMYNNLIDRYYDASQIDDTTSVYTVETITNTNKIEIVENPTVIRAYQDSLLFLAWRSNLINDGDKMKLGSTERFIKISGQLDSQGNSMNYIEIEAHATNTLDKQRNSLIDYTGTKPTLTYVCNSTALNYKIKSSLTNNMTINFSFKLSPNTIQTTFLNGYNNETSQGIDLKWINGQLTTGIQVQTDDKIQLSINDLVTSFPLGLNLLPNIWYSMIITISKEFRQAGCYIYKYTQDLANKDNWNNIELIKEYKFEGKDFTNFTTNSLWKLPAGAHLISNIRIIDSLIRQEQFEYLVTQQIITNLGTKLQLIDNCKERLDLPYISMNR